jgi:Cytosol aminopeptidase family, N-terminal domain
MTDLSGLHMDEALFMEPSEIKGMVVTFHVNERPLQGAVGKLDWRFQGAISHFLRTGALTGQEGECAYLPIKKGERVFHLLLVGSGSSKKPGQRAKPTARVMKVLRENLEGLKIKGLGLSAGDFGIDVSDSAGEFKDLVKAGAIQVIQ